MTETKATPILGIPVPVIGVTGDQFTGKTIFLSSLCPDQTEMIDCEKSSETYSDIGFKRRVDLFEEMQKLGKEEYKPIDAFKWFHNHILNEVKAGEFRVIAVDPISDIEVGLADYVASLHNEYNYKTESSFRAMGGVFWGAVNAFWKAFLGKLSAKCEIFAFSTHLRDEYKGETRTGKKQPKGKKVIAELASLYAWLRPDVAPDGKPRSPVPKATILKSRLGITRMVGDEMQIIPVLPPVVENFSPATIRKYVASPPNWSKLKKCEYEAPHVHTEDEKLEVQREIAELNARTEEAKLQQTELQMSAAEKVKAQREASSKAAQVANAMQSATPAPVQTPPFTPTRPTQESVQTTPSTPGHIPDLEVSGTDNPFALATQDRESIVTPEQAAFLQSQFEQCGINAEQIAAVLKKTNTPSITALPFWRAKELSSKLLDQAVARGLKVGK